MKTSHFHCREKLHIKANTKVCWKVMYVDVDAVSCVYAKGLFTVYRMVGTAFRAKECRGTTDI